VADGKGVVQVGGWSLCERAGRSCISSVCPHPPSASSRPLPIPTLTMCTAAQRALPSSPDCLKTRLWRQGNAALLHLPATSHTPIGYAPSILSNTGTSSSPASRTATGRSRLRDRRTRSRRLRQRRYEGLARQTHPPPTRHSISRRQCHLPTMRCASP